MLWFIRLNEKSRRGLCHAVVWLSVITFLASIFIILYGIDLATILNRYTSLFADYHGKNLKWFLVVCGSASVVVNAIGAYISHLLMKPELRNGFRSKVTIYQLAHWLVIVVACVVIAYLTVHYLKVEDLFTVR